MKDKELRKILIDSGIIKWQYNGLNFAGFEKLKIADAGLKKYTRSLESDIMELREKLNALIALLNVEETSHSYRGMKKGKKEIEY